MIDEISIVAPAATSSIWCSTKRCSFLQVWEGLNSNRSEAPRVSDIRWTDRSPRLVCMLKGILPDTGKAKKRVMVITDIQVACFNSNETNQWYGLFVLPSLWQFSLASTWKCHFWACDNFDRSIWIRLSHFNSRSTQSALRSDIFWSEETEVKAEQYGEKLDGAEWQRQGWKGYLASLSIYHIHYRSFSK